MIWQKGPVPRTGLYWIRTRGTIEPWIQKIYFNERHFEELYEWQPVVTPDMVEKVENRIQIAINYYKGQKYSEGLEEALHIFHKIFGGEE